MRPIIFSMLISTLLLACASPESHDVDQDRVIIGAERLLTDYRELVEGKRVGIITNHSAIIVRDGSKNANDAGFPGNGGKSQLSEDIENSDNIVDSDVSGSSGISGNASSISNDGASSTAGSSSNVSSTGSTSNMSANTIHLIDLLHADPDITVTALFGPEHGLRGQADAGEPVSDSVDDLTGAPIFSLYGETRRPTAEMLANVDVLIFDMQDVGTRFYTYPATMARSMISAAEAGIPFLVLDRPNPLGGNRIEGFIREDQYTSGIGLFPTPVTHGMTVGELARMIQGEQWLDGLADVDLHVIEMSGWTRDMLWTSTGLPWVPPSPNIPDIETAFIYPGTCYFEGTTGSEGRGTYRPFLQVGDAGVDGEAIATNLNQRNIGGLQFNDISFTPVSIPGMDRNPKLMDQLIEGIEISVSDEEVLYPVAAGIHILEAFYNAHSEEGKARFFNLRGMQVRAGNDLVQQMIQDGHPADEIIELWEDDVNRFREQRQPYLIYK
ncbi:MAG: DUF1343 domain-containing protein [Balneolales bacterium]|nr:DUF1343 domain-containing protein [Balneolales bacterium]